MAEHKSKIKKIFSERTCKSEIAEGLFSCPFPRKNGGSCRVSQKYRSLKIHCKKISMASHRDNLDNHGSIPFTGSLNLDGSCLVIPFVGDVIDEHTSCCAAAKVSLKRYSGRMLK